jgi:hypothetical protein
VPFELLLRGGSIGSAIGAAADAVERQLGDRAAAVVRHGDGIVYRNEDTGVELGMAREDSDVLRASIAVPRPLFFALEALPLVTAVGDELGCSLHDADGAHVVADELVAAWERTNAVAVAALRPRLVARSRALAWWRYQLARASLQRALGDDVYVPGLHFVEREAGSVERLLVWTDGMASAMPRCELVFVQRTEGEEVVAAGIVPGAEAIAALRSLLVWERDGEVEVPVVPPDAEAAAQPVVDALIERATIEPGEVVPLSVEELADAGRPV